MQELVSIITPCYNGEKFIAQAIKSVIAQSYSNWEMIIIDDCSSDNSADIIKSFIKQDSRIKYLRTPTPSGSPTMPRNIGIDSAKGRYIAFLDSDDIWLSNKIQNQIRLFENNPNMSVAYSYYEKVDKEGSRDNRVVKSPDMITYKQLLYGNVIGNLTGMYDTHKVGKVYMKYIGHEDYVMWLEILNKGYIGVNTKSIDALYRVHNNSISSNKYKALLWTWNIYRNIEKLNLVYSVYYFLCYAIKAVYKNFI